MTRVRRLSAGFAIAGTLLIPFAVSSAQPASAGCEVKLADGVTIGCPDNCEGTASALSKVMDKLGQEWNCLQ